MSDHESENAAKEARADVVRPERRSRYSDAVLRYLREVAYLEAHRPPPRRTRMPGDEPADDAK